VTWSTAVERAPIWYFDREWAPDTKPGHSQLETSDRQGRRAFLAAC